MQSKSAENNRQNQKTVRKDGFFVEKIVVFELFRQIIVFGRDAFSRVLGNDFL